MKKISLLLIVAILLVSGCTSDNQLSNQADDVVQQPQKPACNQDAVGAWQLPGNQVYFIVEPDCSISKFCDLNEIDIHTTGSISGNKIILDGITTNEIVLNGSTRLTILGGADGVDLPFMKIYREYGIDPIPEDC